MDPVYREQAEEVCSLPLPGHEDKFQDQDRERQANDFRIHSQCSGELRVHLQDQPDPGQPWDRGLPGD